MAKQKTSAPKLELFAISYVRLAVLSIITGGLYVVYWFYRNWKALRPIDSGIKHPVWRAIFSIFYCYSLFQKIITAAKNLGFKRKYQAGVLATLYILLFIIGIYWGYPQDLDVAEDLALSALMSLYFVPLLFVQVAINYINKKQNRQTITNYGRGEIILIAVGVIFTGFSVYLILSGQA